MGSWRAWGLTLVGLAALAGGAALTAAALAGGGAAFLLFAPPPNNILVRLWSLEGLEAVFDSVLVAVFFFADAIGIRVPWVPERGQVK